MGLTVASIEGVVAAVDSNVWARLIVLSVGLVKAVQAVRIGEGT